MLNPVLHVLLDSKDHDPRLEAVAVPDRDEQACLCKERWLPAEEKLVCAQMFARKNVKSILKQYSKIAALNL